MHRSSVGHSADVECPKTSVLIRSAMQMLFLAFRAMFVALFTFPRLVSITPVHLDSSWLGTYRHTGVLNL